METTTSMAQAGQYLTFQMAGEVYAIEILRVKEIIEYSTVTAVPTMPRAVRGVINLRGAVVPVIDLAVQFGLGERAVTKRTCVVIVEVTMSGERVVMGVVADAVSRVEDFAEGQIEPPPAFGTQVKVECLRGMGKLEKTFALILDVDRVLSPDAMLAAHAAAAEGSEPAEGGAARRAVSGEPDEPESEARAA